MATDLKPETTFLEAPASWNTRYSTPTGFVCQITLRSETGLDLLEKADAALSFLLEQGYSPCDNNNNHHGSIDTRWCPIHQCEMRRWEKEGRSWYSHKLEDGGWCRGKQKKEGGSHE
jgi:hypothetical protein